MITSKLYRTKDKFKFCAKNINVSINFFFQMNKLKIKRRLKKSRNFFIVKNSVGCFWFNIFFSKILFVIQKRKILTLKQIYYVLNIFNIETVENTLSTNKKLETFDFAPFVEYLQKYRKNYPEILRGEQIMLFFIWFGCNFVLKIYREPATI